MCGRVRARVRRGSACEWEASRSGEGNERATAHRDEEGGEEEEGESASADRHRQTAEPGAQVSLQIFNHSISRRLAAYVNPLSTLTVGCGCTSYEIKDKTYIFNTARLP